MNWFSKRLEVPLPAPLRLDHDPEYAKWKYLESNIEFLVIVTDTFIVFVDKALDVDWSLRDDSDDKATNTIEFEAVLNRVATLETRPCDEIPRSMKLHFKRLLGEGLARGFKADFNGAQSVLNSAAQYIEARNEETSRLWYLSGSVFMTLPFVAIACLCAFIQNWLQAQIGSFAFWEVLSACAGASGALLSVIARAGKQRFDCSAGKLLHYLESSSRIWAGAISGILVGLAVHEQLFLTALTHNGNLSAIMILAAMVSGASERLATSIIADLETKGASKKEYAP